MIRLLIAITFALLALAPARSQTCFDFSSGVDFAGLDIAEVKTGEKRVRFIDGNCDGGAGNPACIRKAFVTPGDLVLIEQVFDAHACAAFVNAKGAATYGLLPNERLGAPFEPADTRPEALLGDWRRTEATIAISDDADGAYRFEGAATFGALDPERVTNGAVNTGAFSFLARPGSNLLAQLAVPEPEEQGKPLMARPAAEAGQEDGCRVAFAALGPYLAVHDNGMCGGMNVSFTGVYRRRD
jgi:hypothetical protein